MDNVILWMLGVKITIKNILKIIALAQVLEPALLDAGHQNNDKKHIKNCSNSTHAGAASNIIIAESTWKFLKPSI